MAKRMLVDATQPEETRVVVVNGNRLEELDFEIASRKQLKGNIYLAKVTRVEPSLQAAFIEYGGNRHGFLAFSEIHPDYYRIPVADREALLAEERRYADAEEADDEPARPARVAREPVEPVADQPAGSDADPSFQHEPAQHEPAGDVSAADVPVMAEAIPADTVFAEVPASENGENGDNGEHGEPGDGESAAEGVPANAAAAEPANFDVVGGDEVEEMVRRRPRPLRSYKIQEVIKRRQILLVQVTKEERGTKGAALTTYLSLPGRYCVLMPNTGRGGGVSRKITNPQDRKRLKEMLSDLDVPQGMAVILRTAGLERSKAEIKRDLEYLLRLWDSIREQTLQSTAPELIYEEANLIKRSIRDLYANDIDEVLVEGEQGYRVAKDFMRMLVPSHSKRVQPYREETIPLFSRYQVDTQIDAIHSPVVQLKSGGYIVINQTEALVAIDVNSGRSTRERNIEETAYKTNLEASDEVARQLRLRDLAGLIVIDFIDMEDSRNNASVERRLKEAMKTDRARIQLGRISPFGLLELSRQRLRPSLLEANFEKCPHCAGMGVIRSIESAALHALRAVEEEGVRRRSSEISLAVPARVALYILNSKRIDLARIEQRYGMRVLVIADDTLIVPDLRIERVRARMPGDEPPAAITTETAFVPVNRDADDEDDEDEAEAEAAEPAEVSRAEPGPAGAGEDRGDRRGGRRGRRGRRRHGGERPVGETAPVVQRAAPADEGEGTGEAAEAESENGGGESAPVAAEGGDGQARKRRRGKRGGRRRGRGRFEGGNGEEGAAAGSLDAESASDDISADDIMEPADETGEAASEVAPAPAPVRVAPEPARPVVAGTDEVVDFDWFLDGERPAAVETAAEPESDLSGVIVASTEGDGAALALAEDAVEGESPAAPAETVPVAEEPSPRKRTRRRAGADAGEAEAAVVRRTRRRVKMAPTDEAEPPVEIAAEVAPDAAAEIVPELVVEAEPVAVPAPEAAGTDDDAMVAPTEHPLEVPPPPVMIVADAPLPAPTRDSVDDGEAPPGPRPTRRGWWSRG